MNVIEQVQTALLNFLRSQFPEAQNAQSHITVQLNTKDQAQFGDLSCNAAMILAKPLKKAPRAIAQEIVEQFSHPAIEKMEIAGPGFLNIYLKHHAFVETAQTLWERQQEFFKTELTHHHRYCIEFVSANPTGPLHLGHGRGGIIGDVLGNILRFIGHGVTKEFYINDAGSQMNKLGNSLYIRCQQVVGMNVALPEDAYHGEYLVTLAEQCIQEHGAHVLDKSSGFFIEYAKKHLLEQLKATLADYGIIYDVWFSELRLHQDGAIAKALDLIKSRHYLYEKDGALWFKATEFGDDKDRVLRKADGEYTYAAADLAYLENKIERGFDKLIMILGQDHHSYLTRLKAMMAALGHNPDELSIILYQLVTLNEAGQQLRMSKRAGTMVTLDDIITNVGTDVARFFYLNRKADAHLDFDLSLALKKTEENPVYYIQYAYVRINSIQEKAVHETGLQHLKPEDLTTIGQEEIVLLKKIAELKELLVTISHNYQTHLLTYYTLELVDNFHRYYAHHKVINPDNVAQSRMRLAVLASIKMTLASCLQLMGISAPQRM